MTDNIKLPPYPERPVIDPKSTAGVLLREHDNVAQALAYAERKAAVLLAMHSAIGLDYAGAAEELREEQERQRRALRLLRLQQGLNTDPPGQRRTAMQTDTTTASIGSDARQARPPGIDAPKPAALYAAPVAAQKADDAALAAIGEKMP